MWLVALPGLVIGLAGLVIGIYAAIDPQAFASFFNEIDVDEDQLGIWFGIGIPVFIVGIMLLSFSSGIKGAIQNAKNRKRLKERGVRARAKVLGIRDTGITVNDNPYVEITVETTRGSQATFKMMVSRIRVPRPGDTIEVLYDPVDPTVAVAV